MKKSFRKIFFNSFCSLAILFTSYLIVYPQSRTTELFTKGWNFKIGDVKDGQNPSLDDSKWRLLDLPHDWSIEGLAQTKTKKDDVPEFKVVKGEWKFKEGDNL